MTDEIENTEADTDPKPTAKPKAAPKKKAKAKAKPKAEAKPKTETKNKANTADSAPYIQKDSKAASANTEAQKKKSSAPLIFLLVAVALILTTIYKFNEEHSNQPAQADSQENIVVAEPASTVMTQAIPANDGADTSPVQASDASDATEATEQPAPPAPEETQEQAAVQVQELTTNNSEMRQQRLDAYKKEIQLKQQQFRALMEARQQERAEIVKKQKAELQRIKQKQLETRRKAEEIQKQIYDLHEKLRQLMKESHPRPAS